MVPLTITEMYTFNAHLRAPSCMKLLTKKLLSNSEEVWFIPEKGHGLKLGPGLPPQLARLLRGTQPSSCRGMSTWPGCRPAALSQRLSSTTDRACSTGKIKLLADSANRSPGLYILQHPQESPPSHAAGSCQQFQPSCVFGSSTRTTCLEGHERKVVELSLETPTSHTAAAYTPCSLCLLTFHMHPGEPAPCSLHASLASTTCHEELSTAHPYSSIPSAPTPQMSYSVTSFTSFPVLNTITSILILLLNTTFSFYITDVHDPLQRSQLDFSRKQAFCKQIWAIL